MNQIDTAHPVVEIILSRKKRRTAAGWSPAKRRAVIGVVVAIILGIATYTVLAYRQQTTPETKSVATKTASPTPATPTPATPVPKVANALNGALVDPAYQNVHPLAVMIENHPDARPQSGLSQADLVYEAIAEGGITRFMAVFANPTIPVKVGPIRSARTYFVDFATELNAFYAHVGGNMDALDQIKSTNVLDLDQFSVGAPVYNRDYSRPVALEHTMYSSTEKLWDYAVNQRKWSKTGDYQSWLFIDDAAQAQRPASQTVSVSVSDSLYKVDWTYDPTTNSYARNLAGSPHIDNNTGKQITVKDIILEQVNRQADVTRINEHGWHYDLTGSGPATVIQNGKTVTGTWKKEGTGRTRYYDSSGNEISFVRGEIWVEITHSDTVTKIQ